MKKLVLIEGKVIDFNLLIAPFSGIFQTKFNTSILGFLQIL